jgi:hypothetical protein
MRLKDLLNYIDRSTTSGATFDELKNEFNEEDPDEIKRLVNAALDLNEIKRDGKGRGTKYYGINFDIVKIKTEAATISHNNDSKFIDGQINVSKCLNVKEKIQVILASDHHLSQPSRLSYRETIEGGENGKELHDFILGGVRDIDIGLHFDRIFGKNVIYSKQVKNIYNSIWIGNINNTWIIKKIFNGLVDQPDVKEFDNFSDMEKCLKTLTGK